LRFCPAPPPKFVDPPAASGICGASKKYQIVNQVHEISLDNTEDSSSTIYNFVVLFIIHHHLIALINRRQDGFQRQKEEGEEEGF
jgi:hypothetical protein